MGNIQRMQRYIDATKIPKKTRKYYGMSANDFLALTNAAGNNPYSSVDTAFNYGRAMGYRAAKAELRAKK